MSDEEIIKRRLMFDGDGIGDDRRLNLMQKLVCKWANSKMPPEEKKRYYDKILQILSQCEDIPKRSRLVKQRKEKQLKYYKDVLKKRESDIADTTKEIAYMKEIQKKSRIGKQNRVNYVLLINEIMQYPKINEMKSKIHDIQIDNEMMKMNITQLDKQVNTIKKKFQAFMSLANQISIENFNK